MCLFCEKIDPRIFSTQAVRQLKFGLYLTDLNLFSIFVFKMLTNHESGTKVKKWTTLKYVNLRNYKNMEKRTIKLWKSQKYGNLRKCLV